MARDAIFHGMEIELHAFDGARALRVVHPDAQDIAEHRHDRAYIGIHAAGRYRERYDGGELVMDGPCAVLHPPGRPHADVVAEGGLETVTIEFDPSWLRLHGHEVALDRSIAWSGGPAALAARQLAAELRRPGATDAELAAATGRFLNLAMRSDAVAPPVWIEPIRAALRRRRPESTIDLAKRLDLHPAWLARAYRHYYGEGIADTVRRFRVEHATTLLRRTDQPLAEIAAEAEFCDQSHMNRCFGQVLGRTPTRVRNERPFAQAAG